jgi:hypothetical protein
MPIPLMSPPLMGQGPTPGVMPDPDPVLDAVEIEVDGETGDVTIRDPAAPKAPQGRGFDDNLAETLDAAALGRIAETLLRGIEADERSRREMLEQYTRGMDLLGLKLEGDAAGFAAGQGGKTISRIRHPILLWACVRFQSGARNELLPAAGPVKVRIDGAEDGAKDELAKDFERDFNHYLTVTASEYYPDTDRGLFYLGYGGTLFKKVYRCPLRERPVSECVYMPDLIVSNDATDLANAQRVTHRFEMAPATLERLKASGFYLDVALVPPAEAALAAQPAKQKEGQIAGVQPQRDQPEDKQHTIYECYSDIDLAPLGHKEPAARAGQLLPYRVSIDHDSRKVLEIRRNWQAGDAGFARRKRFVKYGLIPGFGFYDYGYLHLIGNHTKALTALWRLVIDAGMFATFPGGLRLKGSRASTNEFRPGPGEFPEIDAAGVEDIRKLIMAMPYKEPSGVILEMIQLLMKDAAQIAGTVELELGEGRTNMPVGTILSMIEQQTQVMSAVHKRNHASQQEELLLLKELFAEDPAALAALNPAPARRWQAAEEFADLDLVPASDPNVPAQIHRIMQSTVLWMLASAAPSLFNQQEVVRRILRTINIGDADSLLSTAPPAVAGAGSAPPDPKAAALAAELPLKQQKLALAQQELLQQRADSAREAAAEAQEAQQRQQDRALKAAIEAAKLAHAREKLAQQRDAATPPASRADGGGVHEAAAAPTGNATAGDASVQPQSDGVAPSVDATPTSGVAQSGNDANPAMPGAPPSIEVRLPDGSFVADAHETKYNQTGHLLAPMADLSHVAQAGREAGAVFRQFLDNGETAASAEPYLVATLVSHFGHGGLFDYQRQGNAIAGYTQLPQFRHVSNFNIGLFAQQAGMSLDEALGYAGLYAQFLSSNTKADQPFGLDSESREFIAKGFQAGASGAFDP